MSLLDGMFEGGDPLNTDTPAINGFDADAAAITPGYLHQLQGASHLVTLTITASTPGKRIAVKVISTDEVYGDLTVAAPSGGQIERLDGVLDAVCDIPEGQSLGAYYEWICDTHNHWLRVTGGGSSGGSLQLDMIASSDSSVAVSGGSTGPIVDLAVRRGTGPNETRPGNDPAYTNARPPAGAAGGYLGGTYPDPDVRAIRESSGPGTALAIGTIADGQLLGRVGSQVVGIDPATIGGANAFKQAYFKALATNQSTTSTTLVDIPGMSLTVDTIVGDILLITVTGSGAANSGGWPMLAVLVDGVQVGACAAECLQNPFSFSWFLVTRVAGLAAGNHTVKAQWQAANGIQLTMNTLTPGNHNCAILVEKVAA